MSNQKETQAGLVMDATMNHPLNTSDLQTNIRRRLSEAVRRVGEDDSNAQKDEDGFYLSFEAAFSEANGYVQGVIDAGAINDEEFRQYQEELFSMLNRHTAFILSKVKQFV